jgi:hypothetical protein
MADLTNFRLSKKANEVAELLVSTGQFDFVLTAAKFGMAYALKNHFDEINPATYIMPDNEGNNYNTGSLDGDGQIAGMLKALYPGCETPYTYARNLMTFGLLRIGDQIDREGLKAISEFM